MMVKQKENLKITRLMPNTHRMLLRGDSLSNLGFSATFNKNGSHHALVFVLEQMAVVRKGANNVWVAKIHANADARIGQKPTVIIGHIYSVPHEILVHFSTQIFKQQKVQLMNVECMQFP